jgi:hypothetical protein
MRKFLVSFLALAILLFGFTAIWVARNAGVTQSYPCVLNGSIWIAKNGTH